MARAAIHWQTRGRRNGNWAAMEGCKDFRGIMIPNFSSSYSIRYPKYTLQKLLTAVGRVPIMPRPRRTLICSNSPELGAYSVACQDFDGVVGGPVTPFWKGLLVPG